MHLDAEFPGDFAVLGAGPLCGRLSNRLVLQPFAFEDGGGGIVNVVVIVPDLQYRHAFDADYGGDGVVVADADFDLRLGQRLRRPIQGVEG